MHEPFVRVAPVTELPPGTATMVAVGDFDIAVFNVAGEFLAVDDVCPHFAGSLHEGTVDGETVTCPVHGWCFDLRDGHMPNGRRSIATFEVRVAGDSVWVSGVPK
ncbi:MAG TPA: Rieske 2Fe-2S domain-containing protein [Candidatus Lustribacter sp.]|jgi:3-phenylpropionate/trans-cinnamate dioxygenase ferredoxin subunit|nr:Rieske 2Fe-2S domain-containing protein [Candidatus Lustribacter sp.]